MSLRSKIRTKTCQGVCGLPKDADRDFYRNRNVCKICYAKQVRAREARAAGENPWPALRAFDAEQASDPGPRGFEKINAVHTFDVSDVAPKPEVLNPVEEHRLKVKNRDLVQRVKSLSEQLSRASEYADILREAREQAEAVEPITPRERTSGILEGMCQVMASDWHVESEVRPEQVGGRNRFNLQIAEDRIRRFFEAIRWGLDFNRGAFKVRDLVLALLGDMITGHLHEDNVENNLLSPTEAIAFCFSHISAGIEFLLGDPELERIVVPCCDGNHGRLTKKMRSATRTEQSIEILLYKMLADRFKGEPRVNFMIATSSQLYYPVYGRTIRYTHLDTVKYGGGVGGITIPIRKAIDRWNSTRKAELTCGGHFHQYTSLDDLIVNGSLIGLDSYAMDIGARYEPPSQAMTMFDPKRWKSVSMPLWVASTDDDQAARSA